MASEQGERVVDLGARRRRGGASGGGKPARRVRRRASAGPAVQGSLALAARPASRVVPTPMPTPARWFSEKNGFIGFRLYDIVYVFAWARRALPPEDAIEWGARYFAGSRSDIHARNVLSVLEPGVEHAGGQRELAEPIREAFRRAISQGAGRLLRRPGLKVEAITEEDALTLIRVLDRLYEAEGWLLPALPFALHLLLRRLDLDL